MALYQDLPVFADVYTLTHKVFLFTQDYPREYKFTLGQDMKRDCLVLLRSIYRIRTGTPLRLLPRMFSTSFCRLSEPALHMGTDSDYRCNRFPT